MEINKKKVNIFDICGTLYSSNTTMDFCEFRCEKKLIKFILILSKSFLGKVVNKILIKFFKFDFIRKMHIKTLVDLKKEKIENDAIRFVKFFLKSKKNNEVHKLLDNFIKKNIILVSATIDPVAKAISEELGGLSYISTTLEYSENRSTGRIKNDLLGNKQLHFKDDQVNFIVTDNKSDLKLCQKATKVMIVSKSKNLNFWNNASLDISRIIKI